MKQIPESVLSQVHKDWLAAGWNLDALRRFRMEAEGDGGTETGEGGKEDPPKTDPPKTTEGISQAEVNRIAAREKSEGKRAAEEAIAKQLGVSIEDAKRIITAAKTEEDKQKTEAQRAKEAADTEKAGAEQEKKEAAKERHDARVERALLRALPKDLDDAALDARVTRISRLVDVEVGAESDAIVAAVAQLKKEMPELFPAAGEAPKGGPNGDPKGGPPKKDNKAEDAFERGLKRAQGSSSGTGYPILDQLKPTANSA